jgi:hypothetical protein
MTLMFYGMSRVFMSGIAVLPPGHVKFAMLASGGCQMLCVNGGEVDGESLLNARPNDVGRNGRCETKVSRT